MGSYEYDDGFEAYDPATSNEVDGEPCGTMFRFYCTVCDAPFQRGLDFVFRDDCRCAAHGGVNSVNKPVDGGRWAA